MPIRIEGEQRALFEISNANILIIPWRNRTRPITDGEPELRVRAVVESEILRRVFQDHMNLGAEDIDQEAGSSRLEAHLRLARHEFTYKEFSNQVNREVSEMSRDLEGSKIGSVSNKLRSAADYVLTRAEEIWTDPQ